MSASLEPQTKYNEIISSVNDRLHQGRMLTKSELFWFNGLKREAEKLLKVDPSQGHIALAALMQLQGDEEAANRHIRCARTANPSLETADQELTMQANFGRFSKALEIAEDLLDPRNGYFVKDYRTALSCGAFHLLANYQKKASDMGVELSNLPTEIVGEVTKILSSVGVSDDKVAQALDVAGEILRERQLFWIGESSEIRVDDNPGHLHTVFLTFSVRASAEDATEMSFELYERLFARFPDHSPAINIGFRSATLQ